MNAPAGDNFFLGEVVGTGRAQRVASKERRAREIERVTFTRGREQQSLT